MTIPGAPTTTRPLDAADQDLLARATLGNVNWSGPRFTLDEVLGTPAFAHYFTPWPGAGDLGLVSESPDGSAVAVAWLRHLPASDPGYGFVDETIPELSIWVAPDRRGEGLGTRLVSTLIDQARSEHLPGISLSVETGNPARALYERLGFAGAGPAFDPGTLLLRL